MKTKINNRNPVIAFLATMALAAASLPATADVFWNGSSSSDWANAANWTGGLPSAGGAGNAILNPGAPFATPTVSTLGNFTAGQTYISIGAGLDVTAGSLSTVDLITGLWGNSAAVNVSGGSLSISGLLNMGAGGFDGDVSISGGSVTSSALSINTLGGAGMDISGSGSYTTAISQLGNINYWIANNNITANGGALGWAVDVDTVSQPGNVILSAVAVPEPTTAAFTLLGLTLLGFRRWKR